MKMNPVKWGSVYISAFTSLVAFITGFLSYLLMEESLS